MKPAVVGGAAKDDCIQVSPTKHQTRSSKHQLDVSGEPPLFIQHPFLPVFSPPPQPARSAALTDEAAIEIHSAEAQVHQVVWQVLELLVLTNEAGLGGAGWLVGFGGWC